MKLVKAKKLFAGMNSSSLLAIPFFVLAGNLISILNGASELAIIAMGMTLVTAACGGQDISVGALATIAGSVFVKYLRAGEITMGSIIVGFLLCCVVAMLFGAFNGTLVSVFKIQPMIATLVLFTCGRSIAYWINGTYGLTGDDMVSKRDDLVVAMKEKIDAEYEDGRQTVMTDKELDAMVERLAPGRFEKV